eukprot:897356-Prorocentrum_minimum.AAC.1
MPLVHVPRAAEGVAVPCGDGPSAVPDPAGPVCPAEPEASGGGPGRGTLSQRLLRRPPWHAQGKLKPKASNWSHRRAYFYALAAIGPLRLHVPPTKVLRLRPHARTRIYRLRHRRPPARPATAGWTPDGRSVGDARRVADVPCGDWRAQRVTLTCHVGVGLRNGSR